MKDRETVVSEILEHIQGGLSIGSACGLAGLGRTSFYRWLKDDPSLKNRLRRAEAQGVGFHLKIINEAAKADWRASAWFLERKYPEKWGRRVIKIEPKQISGHTGILVKVPEPKTVE